VLRTMGRGDIAVESGEGEGGEEGEYHRKERDMRDLAEESKGRVKTGGWIVATRERENEKCLDCL
jgi:hypothetical protein